jgi:hypothetical protein
MDLLKFFRFKKKPVEAALQLPKEPPKDAAIQQEIISAEKLATTPAKKAIAILPYNNLNYFEQVFESVLSQTIDGKSFTELYDLYVFQDGLQARHQNSIADYDAIQTLCLNKLPEGHFQRQPKNMGIALQFAYVEQQIFEVLNNGNGYDFGILLEHDFVLAPGYLQTMESLYQRFEKDERIAAISVHSSAFKQAQEVQEEHKHTYKVMTHDWGAGVFKRTWQKRLPAMQSYYKLLGSLPFEQRNNMLIQEWMSSMGFVKGSTSQDTIKACVDSGLQTLRITPFINQGTYIGAEGMHWNADIYDAAGYGQTVNFVGDYGEAPELNPTNFEMMLANQCQSYMADPTNFKPAEFKERLATGKTDIAFASNAVSNNATPEDITAAYKLFLGRFPESNEVVQLRVGLDMPRLLRSFMLSEEFLQRQENWPMVIEVAKKIVEINRQVQTAASKSEQAQVDTNPQASNQTP